MSGSYAGYSWLPGGETTPTITVDPTETTTYGVVLDDGSSVSLARRGDDHAARSGLPVAPIVYGISPSVRPRPARGVFVSGNASWTGRGCSIGGLPATNVVFESASGDRGSRAGSGAGQRQRRAGRQPGRAVWNWSCARFAADFLDVAQGNPVLLGHHEGRPGRDHGRLRRRELLSERFRQPRADGRLSSQGRARLLPRAAGLHGRLRRRRVPGGVRGGLDRAAGRRRHHGRLRERQLLPGRGREPRPDVCLPAQVGARLVVRAAALHRGLRRCPLRRAVRGLDRAALPRRQSRAAAETGTTARRTPTREVRWPCSCRRRSHFPDSSQPEVRETPTSADAGKAWKQKFDDVFRKHHSWPRRVGFDEAFINLERGARRGPTVPPP